MRSAEQRLDAALQLIDHKVTRGALAEQVVREVMDAFLPGQWTSSSGFVLHPDTRQPSKQVDVLVYDQLAGTPLYSDESVVVLSPERLAIAVEVKSVLDKGTLAEAMENVASFKGAFAGRSGVNAAVYAFRGFARHETIEEHLRAYIQGVSDSNLWPDVICVQQPAIVVTRTDGHAGPALVCRKSEEPVIQSLLTNVLNALGVSGTKRFLPEPKLGDTLFTLK